MKTINGKPIRVRGGSDFRPSRLPKEVVKEVGTQYPRGHVGNNRPRLGTGSTSDLMVSAGKFYECYEGEETEEDHLIPRQSLTTRLKLRLFPLSVDVEDQPNQQRDKLTGQTITVTNPAVVWRSDRTLLRRNKPEQLEQLKVTRVSSQTKRRRFEQELPAVIEVPVGDLTDESL